MFSMTEVNEEKLAFLSYNLSQDTQALRIFNSVCRDPVRGNCRGKASSQVALSLKVILILSSGRILISNIYYYN